MYIYVCVCVYIYIYVYIGRKWKCVHLTPYVHSWENSVSIVHCLDCTAEKNANARSFMALGNMIASWRGGYYLHVRLPRWSRQSLFVCRPRILIHYVDNCRLLQGCISLKWHAHTRAWCSDISLCIRDTSKHCGERCPYCCIRVILN